MARETRIDPTARIAPTRRMDLALALLAAAGCGFDPGPAPLAYELAPATRAALAEDPAALARLEAQLLAAFGTPGAPRIGAQAAAAEPLTAGERELVRAENRRTFARALAALERGEPGDVAIPSRFRALRHAWSSILEQSGAVPATARIRGTQLLEEWSPTLAESAELYRVECLHCHGVAGGGDGPTAHFLEPRPRDFRHGVFKYAATAPPARPRREDLLRVLTEGLNGTSMPGFARLSLAERHGLADLVRLLAIRGEVERRVVATYEDEGELSDDALATELADVLEKWSAEDRDPVVAATAPPPSTPELVARGDALFHDVTRGNCASCHGERGAGDGPAAWKIGLDGRREAAYLDAWDRPIVPRDLRHGIYRGGSRPIDLFRRIWSGIPGTPMPALGAAKTADGAPVVTSDDVWALVHYVRSLAGSAPER